MGTRANLGLFSGFVGRGRRGRYGVAETGTVLLEHVEQRGVEPVPDDERTVTPLSMAWVWLAANVGVFAITVGVNLAGMHLNVWQVLLAVIIGAAGSYAFVALISWAGPASGAPTLVASRATFGVRGNLAPAVVSWAVLAGVEVSLATTATFALREVLQGMGMPVPEWLTIAIVLVLIAAAAAVSFFGHAVIMWIQKWLGWALAGATLIVCVIALSTVDWSAAASAPPGSFPAFLAGIGVVASLTGVGWLSVGADYTRYLPTDTSRLKLTSATLVGSGVPLLIVILSGSILTLGNVMAFGGSASAVGLALPEWLVAPYLVVAFLGQFTAAGMVMYSSGLSLQATGVPLSRPWTSLINSGVIAVVAVVIVAISAGGGSQLVPDLFGAILAILVLPLVSWVGVFGLDLLLRRHLFHDGDLTDTSADSAFWFHRGFHWPAVGAWVFGIVVGLVFTQVKVGDQVWVAGPFAGTWLGTSSLAWLVSGLAATAAYWVLEPLIDHRSIPGRVQLDD